MSKISKRSIQQEKSGDDDDSSWDPYNCWKYWCRLCAKEDRANNDVFYRDGKNVPETSLATAIGKYFWVNIKPDDVLPQYLCCECETLINALCRFTERVNKVQTMFALLQNSTQGELFDPNDLRLQYGLIDEDRQHIIKTPKSIEFDEESNDEFEMESHRIVEEELEEVDGLHIKTKYQKKVKHEDEEGQENSERILSNDDELEIINQLELEIEQEETTNDSLGETMSQEEAEQEEGIEESISADSYAEGEVELLDEGKEMKVFCKSELKSSSEKSQDSCMEVDDDSEHEEQEEAGQEKDVQSIKTVEKSEDISDEEKESDEIKTEQSGNNASEGESTGEGSVVYVDGVKIIRPIRRRRGRPSKQKTANENVTKKWPRKGKGEDSCEEQSEMIFKFECSLCPKKYKSIVVYRRHMLEAHNIIDETVVEYKCEDCSKVFQTQRHLAAHARSHLPLELKQIYPCDYCDKRFTKESILAQHISGIHLNEKPFMCEECGRSLKTLAALKEHKLIHTDDCPFVCEVCNRGFKNKARLKIHSDIHTNTEYRCHICGVVLNTRRTLAMHMLVHSDYKAFKCDYCGSEFKRAKALKNHLIIHTGMKPYVCNFCHKCFSNGSNCRSHKKKAHPAELAALEAEGKREEPTRIPKLDHLRAASKIVDNKKPVSKHSVLPANWRELLLKAEARASLLTQKASAARQSEVTQEQQQDSLQEQQTSSQEEQACLQEEQFDILVEVESQLAQMDS